MSNTNLTLWVIKKNMGYRNRRVLGVDMKGVRGRSKDEYGNIFYAITKLSNNIRHYV